MDVLIESTRKFEQDLDQLCKYDRATVVAEVNACASLFPNHETDGYRKLHQLDLLIDFNDCESSLYTLKLSKGMRAILSVDEDPIFDQVIFTLFRVVKEKELKRGYRDIAKSLYQDFLQTSREPVEVS